MPWRKYQKKDGKYSPIYIVSKGVRVRCDQRKKWTVYVEKQDQRRNVTVGEGRKGLSKAIKIAETISVELDNALKPSGSMAPKEDLAPNFADFSRAWLNSNAGKWDENTLERYECVLRVHLLPDPDIKGKRLDEIKRSDIKHCLRRILKRRSAKTVELAYTILNGIFEEAVEDEILPAHPALKLLKVVLPPKAQRSVLEPDPMTIEERDRFLAHSIRICSLTEQLILKVMAYGGFRLGEALAMRLRYLDIDQQTYRVCESFKLKRFTKPKKGKKRLVDLPGFLVEDLQTYVTHLKKQSLKEGCGGEVDLLFVDPKEFGTWPYSQRKILGLMKKVCRGAGLRIRNPHDLRHTYASIMLMAHQSPAYVQKQLGHSSISITVDVYGHWISGQGRNGLEEALTGGVQKTHISAYEKRASR